MSTLLNTLDAVGPGFANPGLESQAAFRRILTALSRPGLVQHLDGPEPPAGLNAASACVALTLFDFETSVWLAPSVRASANWLRFHCNCPLVGETQAAGFAVLDAAADEVRLAAFHQGDAKYPDRSASLIVQVASLEGGPSVTLEGPGIDGAVAIAPAGLSSDFWDQWADNQEQFQFGVDVFLTAGAGIIGLPRTSRRLAGG